MERIANTPLPYPYVYFPRLFSTLFCVIMPLSLVPSLGWFTPVVSTVVGCMLLAMERIGTDLQAPFGDSQHRIRTEDLCRTIEQNLRSMCDGDRERRASRLAGKRAVARLRPA